MGRSGQWSHVYENNQRLGANQRYVIRFYFGKMKKGFDVRKTTFKVLIQTEKGKKMGHFTIGPSILKSAVPADEGSWKIKFFLLRKTEYRKIIRVTLNHNGKGTLNVTTLEIQKVDSEKANIAYVNDDIRSLPERDALIRQTYPAGSQENREIEKEVNRFHFVTFWEYLAFIWMAINLNPLLTLFIILCRTQDGETSDIHFCSDFHDGIFSSTTSGVLCGTISAAIFFVSIVFFRFVVKKGVAKGSDNWEIIRMVYIAVIVTVGGVSALFSAFDCAKSAEQNQKIVIGLKFETFWIIAFVSQFSSFC